MTSANDAPVVVFGFRRPRELRRVLETVAAARPPRVYLISDGPRAGRPDEALLVESVAAIFDEFAEANPSVRILATTNMGLRRRIGSGLDEVFAREERAIVLEDDCVPHPDFFRFCNELLDRWADEPRVKSISGTTFQGGRTRGPASYYFSHFFHCWGWATWARAWHEVDTGPEAFRLDESFAYNLRARLPSDESVQYFEGVADALQAGTIDSWAFPTMASWWRKDGVHAIPQINLVSNIGFGPGAIHTTDASSPFSAMPARGLTWPLRHCESTVRDIRADEYTTNVAYSNPRQRLRTHIGKKLTRSLKRILAGPA